MFKAYYTKISERYGFNAGAANFGNKPWNYTLDVHKPVIDAIKATGGKMVRMDFSVKDSMALHSIGEYEPALKEYHRQVFDYLAKKDMNPVIVLCSDIQSQYVYRKALADATGNQTYLTDVSKFEKDTNRRKVKINEVFWGPLNYHMSEILKLGEKIYTKNGKKWTGYSIADIDNETAYVIDSEFVADPSIPYGTFPPNYNDMMEHRLYGENGINFYGSIFLPGGYENQSGVNLELTTGGGSFRRYAKWENVHIYINWLANDTKEAFAVRMVDAYKAFALKLDSLNDPNRSGKPIAITEFNGIGIPVELRKDVMVYTAKQLLRNSRVICAIGYSMVENTWNGAGYSESKWAIMNYEKLRFGPSGYVPYDYSNHPSSWNWSGFVWDSPTDHSVTKKQRQCVQVVEKNITIQFKEWFNSTNNTTFWADSSITGPISSYGNYSFTTETDLSELENGVVFSMFIAGKGAANTPVSGQTSEIYIAKIGMNGQATAAIEVFSSTETVAPLAKLKDFPGILPNGRIKFNLEYRPTFIKWDWFDEFGNNIFTHTHTGYIPDPSMMVSKVKASISGKPGSESLFKKPSYVAMSEFKFTP